MRDASIQAKGPASGLLIVDDETEPRQALAALLASAGFDVRQAADAQQAEEHLTAGDVAIVVVDSDMPDVNGFQLCRRIREVYGSQPYLILRTTKDQLFSRELDVDEGADDFLIEPLSNKEVLARVETGRKMKQLQEKLEETNKSLALLEVTDPLTGAFNKRRTDSEVKREMARARRELARLLLAAGEPARALAVLPPASRAAPAAGAAASGTVDSVAAFSLVAAFLAAMVIS